MSQFYGVALLDTAESYGPFTRSSSIEGRLRRREDRSGTGSSPGARKKGEPMWTGPFPRALRSWFITTSASVGHSWFAVG